jgi:hypothetical protein
MKVFELYNALYNNALRDGKGQEEVYADILDEGVDLYAGSSEDADHIATIDTLP